MGYSDPFQGSVLEQILGEKKTINGFRPTVVRAQEGNHCPDIRWCAAHPSRHLPLECFRPPVQRDPINHLPRCLIYLVPIRILSMAATADMVVQPCRCR